MGRVLLLLIPIVLAIWAVIDCAQSPRDTVRALPKWAWVALIILTTPIGPLAWIGFGRPRRAQGGGGPGGGEGYGGGGRPPRGPIAPDDDPEFLRKLDRERWEIEQAKKRMRGEDGPPPASPA
jgi:hypothetical protein